MSLSIQTKLPPTSAGHLIRVALVEDDPVQRFELFQLIQSGSDLLAVAALGDAEEAMDRLPSMAPNVVLMDIHLDGMSGIDVVRTLKPRMPATQFMILTIFEDTENIFAALAAGATGYLLKKSAPARLIESIRELHEGGAPMSGAIARQVMAHFRQPLPAAPESAQLSPREQQILDLLAQGCLYKEIADTLSIALGTVRTHVCRIYEKLHARNRAEAVRKMAPPRAAY